MNILSLIAYLISIISFTISIFYFYVQHKFTYWSNRNVPCLPNLSFPFGNVKGMGRTKHFARVTQNIYEMFKTNNKFAGFYFTVQPSLLVIDLDLVKNILVKDFHIFPTRGLYYNEKGDPLSAHLFNMDEKKWKNIRPKVSPAFTSGMLKSMFHLMTKMESDLDLVLTQYAHDKNVLNIRDVCMRLTGDIISMCAFSMNSNCLIDEDNEFVQVAKATFNFSSPLRQISLFVQNTFDNISRKLNLRSIPKVSEDYYMNFIRNTINLRDKNQAKHKDVMELLLQLHRQGTVEDEGKLKDVGKITYNELAAQAFVFFVAGFETTATTLMFVLFELSKNQELQNEVRKEIKNMLEKYDNELTYDGVNELKLSDRVVKGLYQSKNFL